jgi:hypothetical protein
MAGDKKELVFGVALLRIALAGGLFVIVYLAASFIPMPNPATAMFKFINSLWELALWIGLTAPVVAIVGALLLRFRRQRFMALDWVSLAVGVSTFLLPALFIYAYSNCPNRVC